MDRGCISRTSRRRAAPKPTMPIGLASRGVVRRQFVLGLAAALGDTQLRGQGDPPQVHALRGPLVDARAVLVAREQRALARHAQSLGIEAAAGVVVRGVEVRGQAAERARVGAAEKSGGGRRPRARQPYVGDDLPSWNRGRHARRVLGPRSLPAGTVCPACRSGGPDRSERSCGTRCGIGWQSGSVRAEPGGCRTIHATPAGVTSWDAGRNERRRWPGRSGSRGAWRKSGAMPRMPHQGARRSASRGGGPTRRRRQ